MEKREQVDSRDGGELMSPLRVFAWIYGVMAVLFIPLWMLAAHLAAEQSRTVFAKFMYLIVGVGFLVTLKFLGLGGQYDVAFGALAILINAFVYACVIWFFTMVARMVRTTGA